MLLPWSRRRANLARHALSRRSDMVAPAIVLISGAAGVAARLLASYEYLRSLNRMMAGQRTFGAMRLFQFTPELATVALAQVLGFGLLFALSSWLALRLVRVGEAFRRCWSYAAVGSLRILVPWVILESTTGLGRSSAPYILTGPILILCMGLVSTLQLTLRPALRVARERCSRCGYPLRGLRTRRCPECGYYSDEGKIPLVAEMSSTEARREKIVSRSRLIRYLGAAPQRICVVEFAFGGILLIIALWALGLTVYTFKAADMLHYRAWGLTGESSSVRVAINLGCLRGMRAPDGWLFARSPLGPVTISIPGGKHVFLSEVGQGTSPEEILRNPAFGLVGATERRRKGTSWFVKKNDRGGFTALAATDPPILVAGFSARQGQSWTDKEINLLLDSMEFGHGGKRPDEREQQATVILADPVASASRPSQ